MTTFTNKYLSYSRISRYEKCPLSFKFHYIDKIPAAPRGPLVFGKMIHRTLETAVKWCMRHKEPLTADVINGKYDRAFIDAVCKAEKDLSADYSMYSEGKEILRDTLEERRQLIRDFELESPSARKALDEAMAIDPSKVLDVEAEITLRIGDREVVCIIDRIDRVDGETIDVIDYKTNRMIPTRQEVDSSLQLSLYAMAAKKLYPWARHVKLGLHMLRHGFIFRTSRTEQQLEDAADYVSVIGKAMDETTEFPARLNDLCPWCEFRTRCPAFSDALAGEVEEGPSFESPEEVNIVDLCFEREELANVGKCISKRKSDIDARLKGYLEHKDQLVGPTKVYAMATTRSFHYPLNQASAYIAEITGDDITAVTQDLASVDKKKLTAKLKAIGSSQGSSAMREAKATLEGMADVTRSPRMSVKNLVSPPGKKG